MADLTKQYDKLFKKRRLQRHLYKEALNERLQEIEDLHIVNDIRHKKNVMRKRIKLQSNDEDLDAIQEKELVDTLVKTEVNDTILSSAMSARKEKVLRV